jgi:hypothetical protein
MSDPATPFDDEAFQLMSMMTQQTEIGALEDSYSDLCRELERLTQDETPDFDHARRLMDGLFSTTKRKLSDIGVVCVSDEDIFKRRFQCRVCGWRMFRNPEHLECYLALAEKYRFDRGWDVDLHLVEFELERGWHQHFQKCHGSLVERFIGRVRQSVEPEAGRSWSRVFSCNRCNWRAVESRQDVVRLIAQYEELDGREPSICDLWEWYMSMMSYHAQMDGQCQPERAIGYSWQREGF